MLDANTPRVTFFVMPHISTSAVIKEIPLAPPLKAPASVDEPVFSSPSALSLSWLDKFVEYKESKIPLSILRVVFLVFALIFVVFICIKLLRAVLRSLELRRRKEKSSPIALLRIKEKISEATVVRTRVEKKTEGKIEFFKTLNGLTKEIVNVIATYASTELTLTTEQISQKREENSVIRKILTDDAFGQLKSLIAQFTLSYDEAFNPEESHCDELSVAVTNFSDTIDNLLKEHTAALEK